VQQVLKGLLVQQGTLVLLVQRVFKVHLVHLEAQLV
jgi:hypothetical protein